MRKAIYVVVGIFILLSVLGLSIIKYSTKSFDHADSAIVLGAAAWDGEPSPVFKARIDHAIDLYKEDNIQKIYFTGGTDDPSEPTEAETAKRYALLLGVEEKDVEIETTSQTTMQNIDNISVELDPGEKVLIVTDPLHGYRSIKMARRLDLDAYPAPTPHTRYISTKTQLPFLIRETYFMIVFWIFRI